MYDLYNEQYVGSTCLRNILINRVGTDYACYICYQLLSDIKVMEDKTPAPNSGPPQDLADKLKYLDKETLAALVSTLTMPADRKRRLAKYVKTPYYDKKFAKQLIPVLEAMQRDGKPRMYRYSKIGGRLQARTLRARLYYSLRYIQDAEDADFAAYTEFARTISIETEKAGIYFGPKRPTDFDLTGFEEYDESLHGANAPSWRYKLAEFLKSDEVGKQFTMTELELSEEEIEDAELRIANADNVIGSVTRNMIKLVKIDPADYAQLNPEVPSDQ